MKAEDFFWIAETLRATADDMAEVNLPADEIRRMHESADAAEAEGVRLLGVKHE